MAVVRCVVIEGNGIINVVMANPSEGNNPVLSDYANIGYTYDGERFSWRTCLRSFGRRSLCRGHNDRGGTGCL